MNRADPRLMWGRSAVVVLVMVGMVLGGCGSEDSQPEDLASPTVATAASADEPAPSTDDRLATEEPDEVLVPEEEATSDSSEEAVTTTRAPEAPTTTITEAELTTEAVDSSADTEGGE